MSNKARPIQRWAYAELRRASRKGRIDGGKTQGGSGTRSALGAMSLGLAGLPCAPARQASFAMADSLCNNDPTTCKADCQASLALGREHRGESPLSEGLIAVNVPSKASRRGWR